MKIGNYMICDKLSELKFGDYVLSPIAQSILDNGGMVVFENYEDLEVTCPKCGSKHIQCGHRLYFYRVTVMPKLLEFVNG
jgi:DNA-directed RNA polymerase subunit RPC12/RpoP